ncbi:MAG: nickel pincer cofactor biosynthesis protein LarB [Desulfobulbaceae bacterium]|nr:nickel pincer cofactor biosynthesis protein LarB [Desulfobulbaceae bacterium]MDP2104647.1 nickel pincer cofactor biosynthesis protein LarB [Desulfobulbaceae bacterium]
MDQKRLKKILLEVRGGELSVDGAIDILKGWPSEVIDGACLDHHRQLRTEIPEVIYGENKTTRQIIDIATRMLRHGYAVMATRVDAVKADEVCQELPELTYSSIARMLTARRANETEDKGRGVVAVLAAGTSDLPVAEEACVTLSCLGHRVDRAFDVGVAGIHRLFAHKDLLSSAAVLVVVAGMEGALPSVVAGLVDTPVIAVPTSVGYGTGLGGVAALMGMLNGCAPGIAVVNIDNGFGAGCMAAAINRRDR